VFVFFVLKEVVLIHFTFIKSLDGGFFELDPIEMDGSTTRGFGIYLAAFSRDERKKIEQVEYRGQKCFLPSPVKVFVLDSEATLNHFNYFDTRYNTIEQNLLVDPMSLRALGSHKPVPTIYLLPQNSQQFQGSQGGMMSNSQNILQEEDGLTFPNKPRKLRMEEDDPTSQNTMGMSGLNGK